MKKNQKGFTLIELLAVIVILGLLMAIAIPNVTRYITQSRKKTLTSTINNYISAIVNDINDLTYTFTGSNTIYAVPIECIEVERGGSDPFGEWHQANDNYWAYVLVQYDDNNSKYIYGFTFKDNAGYGIYPKTMSKIEKDGSQIALNLAIERPINNKLTSTVSIYRWLDSGFYVDENTKFQVLTASGEGQKGDGITTCTLRQKGKNNGNVKYWASKPITTDKFGMADLEINLNLENKPIYNDYDNEQDTTINGNGYTINQNITSKDNLTWKDGKVPDLAYVFSSSNGSKVTVSDLNIVGQAQTILLGHYVNSSYKNFNTELNNVNIVGLEVFTYSGDLAAGVFVYGQAKLNSCNIYDTKISSLETNSYRLFDLAAVNFSTTTINNSKLGSIYTWEHAYLELNDSEVDKIVSTSTSYSTGGLVIGKGSKVGTIKTNYPKKVALTVKAGATVDTIDLTGVTDLASCNINIEDGATVKNIIYP